MTTPVTPPNTSNIKRKLIWFAILVIGCVLLYPLAKRTLPGHLIRFFVTDQAIGRQIPNDLADDVRHKWRLASLQEWSIETLARYRNGQVATNGKTSYCSRGTVKLASSEIPWWLSGAWWGESPEVSIRLNDSGEPECIAICWYIDGLLVGPTNYITTIEPWYMVQAKPGIYAYEDDK